MRDENGRSDDDTSETMPDVKPTTVLVCVNRRFKSEQPSCAARGSEKIADALEAGILERRIDVRLERIICLGHCTRGPNVRFAPGGRFNHATKPSDVAGLLDELEDLCGRKGDDDGPPLHLLGN